MREIKLSEINKINQSPETLVKDNKVIQYVRNRPDYKLGRKRPKDANEIKILKSFDRNLTLTLHFLRTL